jgi:hypothetical protein
MTAKRTPNPGPTAPSSPGGGEVSIQHLTLQVPGRNAAFGRRVAESAMEHVARGLPPGAIGHIPILKLSVRADDLGESGLSRAIGDAVGRAIARRRA